MLARLHECKYLLLSLVVITVLPAIPELFIRSKSWSLFISNLPPGPLWSPLVRASAFSPQGLIVEREKKRLSSSKYFPQGRHVRLVHPLQTAPTPPPPCCPCPPLPLQTKVPPSQIIPKKKATLFFRTFAAKRISLIFLGEPAVCECGPSGAELTRPHECPKMARWSNFCNFFSGGRNPIFGFQVETRHLEGHREQAGRENAAPRLSSLHRGEDQEVLARPPRRPGELPS